MEKEKVTTISSIKSISNDERSSLHKSIEQASRELEIFHLSVELAKKSKYTDKNVNFFAKEIFNKYSSSAIQVDSEGSLSMEKSIWVYADKLFDLSKYVEELHQPSHTSKAAPAIVMNNRKTPCSTRKTTNCLSDKAASIRREPSGHIPP